MYDVENYFWFYVVFEEMIFVTVVCFVCVIIKYIVFVMNVLNNLYIWLIYELDLFFIEFLSKMVFFSVK